MARSDSDETATSVLVAAQSGDLRATYTAIRDDLALKLDLAEPAVAAQIAGQLRQVLKDIAALPAPKGVSSREKAQQSREARRSAAATPAPAAAKGGRKRG